MKNSLKLTEKETFLILENESNFADENILAEWNHCFSRDFESFLRINPVGEEYIDCILN